MQNPLENVRTSSPILSLVGATRVPNSPPSIPPSTSRLAIIGEAPGADEEAYGTPFIGASGKLLDSILQSCGIDRRQCFVGNVCKHRPPGNDITEWGYDHSHVMDGATELRQELAEFQPNCVLLLGNTPLHFAAGLSGVSSWRGSILSTSFGKSIPSLHPASVLREYSSWPLLRFDIQRAFEESRDPQVVLPVRVLDTTLTAEQICHRLDSWPSGHLLSFDIEGGLDAFPCASVADAFNNGFIIAWARYSTDGQARVARSLSHLLYRSDVPKCLQNSLYDRFVLAYGYRMLIRNVVEDTMLKQWEIYPELPKGLGVITSIWTREPHYKASLMIYTKKELDRQMKSGGYDHSLAQENKYKGCILDSCVTLEACLAMDSALSPPAKRHYDFNVDLLSPLLYMELKGFNYDKALAVAELEKINAELMFLGQFFLQKTDPFPIGKKGGTTNEIRGKKGSISSQRLAKVLYEVKGYPAQYQGKGSDKKITCDVEALLNLQKTRPNDPYLAAILRHRKLEGLRETLEVQTDPDGRVRCGYNLVGTETGRLTCYTSPTGSGANLQTITKKLRKLYRADPGYHLFQCDLAGADGWTVAAHCLREGDSTMWDDYKYGLKPALIITLLYLGTATNATSRADLLRLSEAYKQWEKENEDSAWIYFASKRVQHGSNYGMQEKTMAKQIMEDSYKLTGKPVYVDLAECGALQRLYFSRYPGIYAWHRNCKKAVRDGHNLLSASGHTRVFFGRRVSWSKGGYDADHETWKEYLADEPQENTTYATNLALWKLWHDRENRGSNSNIQSFDPSNRQSTLGLRTNSSSSLIIQPIHQVHDALIGQFPIDRTEWAIEKIRSYFNNTLEITGLPVTIPFDGAYGPSWGELGKEYGGGKI